MCKEIGKRTNTELKIIEAYKINSFISKPSIISAKSSTIDLQKCHSSRVQKPLLPRRCSKLSRKFQHSNRDMIKTSQKPLLEETVSPQLGTNLS